MSKPENTKAERLRAYLLPAALILLFLPLGLLLPRLCEHRPDLIERAYALGVYPAVKDGILAVSAMIPFSFAEFLIIALAITVPLLLIAWVCRAVKQRSGRPIIVGVLTLIAIFSVGLNLFYLTWGFNYFRAPLAKRLELDVHPREVLALTALLSDLSDEATSLRSEVAADETGLPAYDGTQSALLSALLPAYDALSERTPALRGNVAPAKPVLFSRALSRAGIAGVYVGLTAEANVNIDQPIFSIPASAAHEMAHQLGVASEDAAEFVAFLACRESASPFIRYSGTLQMLIRAGNRLHAVDAEAYQSIYETYSDGVRADLAAQKRYWDGYEGPVEEFVDRVNDGYLKHNAQSSGVQSYGEAVDLLLAWHEEQNNF